MSSDNILSEQDPTKIRWQMLPEGDTGIRNPQFGSVQEEHNVVPLQDSKSLFCIYRTEMGFPACSYSYDSGKKWTTPEPVRYYPGGPVMRTPRACPMVWRCQNGKYLFWFHCNGYKYYRHSEPPISRNLVWLSGGVEREGEIHWSQPELINYEDNTWRGSSYPDLIEHDGNYYISSTQKVAARCQLIDKVAPGRDVEPGQAQHGDPGWIITRARPPAVHSRANLALRIATTIGPTRSIHRRLVGRA